MPTIFEKRLIYQMICTFFCFLSDVVLYFGYILQQLYFCGMLLFRSRGCALEASVAEKLLSFSLLWDACGKSMFGLLHWC